MKRRLILLSVIVAVAIANVTIFKVINDNRTSCHTSFSIFSEALAQSEGGEKDEKENWDYCPNWQYIKIWCSSGSVDCTPKDCP